MSFEREQQEPHLPALSVDCENLRGLRGLELLLAHLLSQWLSTELLESPAHFQPLAVFL